MKIQLLPEQVANQIAAGEVVDRPASVVRELVDNSVDAGATEILVAVAAGGQTLIRVTDNGCGMDADDVVLAFERHATSKIRTADELRSITTYGFRGEALPAIASVSKVRLRSRGAGAQNAAEVRLEGGKRVSLEPVAGPPGTEFEVSSLFFNTPARRKFLKSPRTEDLRIRQWVSFSSLAKPEIHYRLTADGKEVLNLPPRKTLMERAEGLFGAECVRFEDSYGPCRVSGLLLHPSKAEAGANNLVTLVNGRVVSDKLLIKAIRDGFSGTLREREYPVGAVHIELPPFDVDVNVHPQKSEVRFSQPQGVFYALRTVVERAVVNFRSPVYAVPVSFGGTANVGEGAQPLWEGKAIRGEQQSLNAAGDRSGAPLQEFRFSELKYLGQVFECYLLCEHNGNFIVVDMHAAHERLNYNRLRRLRKEKGAPLQATIGLARELPSGGAETLSELKDELEALGFGFRLEGGRLMLMHHPAMLEAGGAVDFLAEVGSGLLEAGSSGSWEARVDALCARAACHASVRSGKVLCADEVRALFAAMDGEEFSAACPHGRPAVVSFSKERVEQWFGRNR